MLGVSAMSFSTFSKEFTANMFTSVENQFITKYLPQAEGDAVRVYLYGLYLCQCADDFDAQALSRLLKIPEEKIAEIYGFWEECDLVHILSRELRNRKTQARSRGKIHRIQPRALQTIAKSGKNVQAL